MDNLHSTITTNSHTQSDGVGGSINSFRGNLDLDQERARLAAERLPGTIQEAEIRAREKAEQLATLVKTIDMGSIPAKPTLVGESNTQTVVGAASISAATIVTELRGPLQNSICHDLSPYIGEPNARKVAVDVADKAALFVQGQAAKVQEEIRKAQEIKEQEVQIRAANRQKEAQSKQRGPNAIDLFGINV